MVRQTIVIFRRVLLTDYSRHIRHLRLCLFCDIHSAYFKEQMKNCVLAILLLLLTAAFATAQKNDGSATYLQSMCQATTRIENNNQLDATDYQKEQWCRGYIEGVVDADTIREKPFLHIPDNVTTGEMQKVVMRFMEEHPEILHDPSVFVVRVALFRAYPQSSASKR
jgi:hypothetical protein